MWTRKRKTAIFIAFNFSAERVKYLRYRSGERVDLEHAAQQQNAGATIGKATISRQISLWAFWARCAEACLWPPDAAHALQPLVYGCREKDNVSGTGELTWRRRSACGTCPRDRRNRRSCACPCRTGARH